MDRERFFRVIDREILQRASRVSGLPLVLASLPEHQSRFRALSHNPFLLVTGLAVNPGALSPGELRQAYRRSDQPCRGEEQASEKEYERRHAGQAHGDAGV